VPRHDRHGTDPLRDLGQVGERRVLRVSERQVSCAILIENHRGTLPERASVVVPPKDQALLGCNRFQLLPGKRREDAELAVDVMECEISD